MHLTMFSDYSLRVLIYLAVRGGSRSTCEEIAAAYGISENHLRKVVNHLASHGHIEATRGKGGGMRLSRPPQEINIGAVVRGSEANPQAAAYFRDAGRSRCCTGSIDFLNGILSSAVDSFFAALETYTLADLLATRSQLAGTLMRPGPRH